MAPLVASDVYPVVRAFLEENELAKSAKAFDKDTTTEEPSKSKKPKALAELTLVAATQAFYDAQSPDKARTVDAADVYPALRRFLVETSLQKCLKSFDKEAATEEELSKVAKKKAKVLAGMELTAACQLWLDGCGGDGAAAEEEPKKNKRKATEEAVAEAAEEPPMKKKKAEKEEKNRTKIPGTPFQRIDCDKWSKAIKDDRLRDNTHMAKAKFGDDDGDDWGNKAAVDLGAVKGKGFRKEMAKKKRASWRGGGEINQGVNSIAFSDSEDDG